MEGIILRFPSVAESIFSELDNGSLANSKMVTNLWASFITAGKIPWIRMILKYSRNMVEMNDIYQSQPEHYINQQYPSTYWIISCFDIKVC